ncbi:kinase-like domain-containing protein [Rhizophagus clarus]|uniref:Kinase-like domain-containing protein n=1 Tax=Rhizophagus clarus TaxID=94130 RepID=A0A8H3KSU0_9GLOM|nr:kinase-like domain-containing protein [Rhizophagus clarus]
MDQFILEKSLKWIPYNHLKNFRYLVKGGFSIVLKAIWKYKNNDMEVVLKYSTKVYTNLDEFLYEYELHCNCLSSNAIIYIYGFTKHPETLNYMIVMDYANKGNLRGNLTEIIKGGWKQRLYMLFKIISGLNEIHNQNLIHCDFHDGNILIHKDKKYEKDKESKYDKKSDKKDGNGEDEENDEIDDKIYISDLRLSRSVKYIFKKEKIYGVIPYIAPEVLRGRPYTPASLRPEIIKNTPQCYVDLMKRCWNDDLSKRPTALEVLNIIKRWIIHSSEISEELKSNIMEFIDAPIGNNNLITEYHPQAIYTSRLLTFYDKDLDCNDISDCMSCRIDDYLDIETVSLV